VSDLLARAVALAYFMAPAYVANLVPPFVKYWRGWNRPISRRWLGGHKTVVGFGAGLAGALLTTHVQARLGWAGGLVAYDDWATLGLLFGVGAMAGDSAKSFLKRRRGIAPGAPWVPFDQLDFVVGALALAGPRAPLGWTDILLILVLSAGGHVLVNHLGWALGIRETRW